MTTTQDRARAVTLLGRAAEWDDLADQLDKLGNEEDARWARYMSGLRAREAKELKAGVS